MAQTYLRDDITGYVTSNGIRSDGSAVVDDLARLVVQLTTQFVHAPLGALRTGRVMLVTTGPNSLGDYTTGESDVVVDGDSMIVGNLQAAAVVANKVTATDVVTNTVTAAAVIAPAVNAYNMAAVQVLTDSLQSLNPATGLMVDQVTFRGGTMGTADFPIERMYVDTIVTRSVLSPTPASIIHEFEWHLGEQLPTGTPGGHFPERQWMSRRLNHERLSNTSTGAPSLSSTGPVVAGDVTTTILDAESHRFTLLPGAYDFMWMCPGVRCGSHRSALYNVTLGRFDGFGNNAMSHDNVMTVSRGETNIVLESLTTFELQHFCSSTRRVDGMGTPCGLEGVQETYAQIRVRGKVAF